MARQVSAALGGFFMRVYNERRVAYFISRVIAERDTFAVVAIRTIRLCLLHVLRAIDTRYAVPAAAAASAANLVSSRATSWKVIVRGLKDTVDHRS